MKKRKKKSTILDEYLSYEYLWKFIFFERKLQKYDLLKYLLCLLNITNTLCLCILIKLPISTLTSVRIACINMHISVSRGLSQMRKNPRCKKKEENVQVPRRATKRCASLVSSKFRFFRSKSPRSSTVKPVLLSSR